MVEAIPTVNRCFFLKLIYTSIISLSLNISISLFHEFCVVFSVLRHRLIPMATHFWNVYRAPILFVHVNVADNKDSHSICFVDAADIDLLVSNVLGLC